MDLMIEDLEPQQLSVGENDQPNEAEDEAAADPDPLVREIYQPSETEDEDSADSSPAVERRQKSARAVSDDVPTKCIEIDVFLYVTYFLNG